MTHPVRYGKKPPVRDMVEVATEAAVAGGRLLRKHWGTTTAVYHKGVVDLVTAADLEVEELVVQMLQGAFPNHGIVGEESRRQNARAEYCWYVDPLDGTTNFAHKHPHFAVSVALTFHGRPVLGVINDPLREEVFTATQGNGAALNGEQIRVSTTPTLDQALLGTGFPYDRRERARVYLRPYERFLTYSQGIRRAGSAALDLCYVACGRFDGFWERSLRPWDTAAGQLIVAEAGGTVSDFRGCEFRLGGPHLLASNGAIHPEMLRVLREMDDGSSD